MTIFHAVMLDETRCEFGVDVEADTKEEAYAILRENYCESRCVQLESPKDAEERERRMYERLEREEEGDFREYDYEQEWG
jgi:hypothetical protein